MIVVERLSRVVGTGRGARLVLDGIDARFEPRRHYVILGHRGAGKTTLLRIMAGVQAQTGGRVHRRGSVSIPPGAAVQVGGNKTVRQLVAFLAALYDADPRQVAEFCATFSGLGGAFDLPMAALSPVTRARLGYALVYALPCDHYLFDDSVAYGDVEYRRTCWAAFEARRRHGGTIVATRDVRGATRLGDCGAVLHAGKLHAFERIEQAIEAYRELELRQETAGLAYAEALLRAGNTARAEVYLRRHLAENEEGVAAYELLAELSLKAGNLPEAAEAAGAALERAPRSVAARLVQARVAEREGRFRDCVSWAETVVELAPEHRDGRILLARMHERLGQHREAAAAWRALSAPTGDALGLRLALRAELKAGNWSGVLATVALARTGRETDRGLLELEARALLALHRWDEARHAIGALAGTDPERALNAIYHLVKTPEWAMIPAMLEALSEADLAALRTSHTMRHLLSFLERRAGAALQAGQDAEADRLLVIVALIDPTRPRTEPLSASTRSEAAAKPPVGSEPVDLATAHGIVRELFDLRAGRRDLSAEEFAERHKAAWAAAKSYLANTTSQTPIPESLPGGDLP